MSKPKTPDVCSRCSRPGELKQVGLPLRRVENGIVVVQGTFLCEECRKWLGACKKCPGEAHQHGNQSDHCAVCMPGWGIVELAPLTLALGVCYAGDPRDTHECVCAECGTIPRQTPDERRMHPLRSFTNPLGAVLGLLCQECERRLRCEARERADELRQRHRQRRSEAQKRRFIPAPESD